jgi:hypothetical protein
MQGISFLWVLAAIAALAVIFGLRTWLAYRRLTAEAEAEWDYQVSENMQDLRLTKTAFVRAFRKVSAPRASLYLAGGLAAILLLTPIAFGLINLGLYGVWKASGESRVFEPGYLVWEFSIFFAIIAIWALIGANVARRYHRNAPGLMRDELIYERAGFMPKKRLTVGANPAHIEADTKGGASRADYRKIFEGALGLNCTTEKGWNGTPHDCDIYGDGSEMKICVHSPAGGTEIGAATHPFFFETAHAREDDIQTRYSLIFLISRAHDAFEKIAKHGLPMSDIVGGETSRLRSFSHETLDVFLYDERG